MIEWLVSLANWLGVWLYVAIGVGACLTLIFAVCFLIELGKLGDELDRLS